MRARLNKGNLYPTVKQAGHKDLYFEFICKTCKGKILKKDSEMSVPTKTGIDHYHLRSECLINLRWR